ncbi:MAG: protein kinase, partial [Oscillospiraceae bacterium]|nr:protein kinase [Oscillospiraceae bacterium]
MSELKMVSPLLSNMEVVRCVSNHGGASVYIVRSTKSQTNYILKHISVPESQRQIDALRYSGAANTDEEAQKYYEQVVEDYKTELETLESLSGHANIACYRSYQIEPKEDAVGFDLYLLAEDRQTLKDHLEQTPMTHLAAVNLAIDLCDALIDLRAAGLVHRDVKPSNIYLNVQNHFVIGDLGLAKLEELKYCSMPESMISIYSAPELFDLVGTIDPTADIYSVGLILYRIFNGNHAPFEDEKTSARAADKQRITGQTLPAPMYADYEMTEILLKACAFSPADRFATPEEFKQALVEYTKRNQLDESLIVPPIVADEQPVDLTQEEEEIEPVEFADVDEMPEDFKESFSPDTQMLNSIIDAVHRDMENDTEEQIVDADEEDPAETVRKRRKKNKFLFLIPIAAVLVVAAAVYFLIIAPSTIHIDSITLVAQESTSLSVNVNSAEKDGSFGVLCSDAYGNTYRQSYLGKQDNVFTNLVPGTQYTISVEPLNDEKLTGDYTLRVSTVAETEVLSFTATPVSITQV